MKKNIKYITAFCLLIATILIWSCKDENANDHANTPRSEPGDGYKTPGPSAGDNSDTCNTNKNK